MAETGDCILVYFLDEQPLGKQFLRKRKEWPLHITLAPWFEVVDEPALIANLEALAGRTESFSIQLGPVEQFGNNATVTVVVDQTAVRKLQEVLLKVVASVRDNRWVGKHYKAHVTHHDGQPSPETGAVLDLSAFWLVRLLPDNVCEIAHRFALKGNDETAA